ncbi:hypothetical protein QMG83_01205 [Salinibacterium sp. G-O1]|uniref:hypothetical protein n=1 Tax=Salinibacterium sp. G-O1 TaxID=3046208 RepID=UPI0024B9BC9B|nr:hypothetical protein [Salinibacterium sp. G-O1]MDJ0333834.1 hypothetical protein [Salinibacterium sp. G-O1]
MTPTDKSAADSGISERFQSQLIESGMQPAVAAELERRIGVIEREEFDDESRRPLSGREIAVYVGVTVLAVAIGALVVAL